MIRQTRDKFLKFFESKGHKIVDSFSLIPQNDPTLLFVNSGMAPLKRFFLQESTPPSQRMTNSQRCLRVGGKHNDLAEVGYTKRHHTFFEMLGNFSFGDYFQQDAIAYAWEFLTEVVKLDKARLYITVHPDDHAAFDFWANIVPVERIYKLTENVWSMGAVGPFGYCSEIFYDLSPQNGAIDLQDGDRFLEIWNLVFMKYYTDGVVESNLPKPCIDAGMGLERLVSVLEGEKDTYDISFFKQCLSILKLREHNVHSKIFLDHLRSIAMLVNESILPGPSGREYVLRRLMRRMFKAVAELNIHFNDAVCEILQLWRAEYDLQLHIDEIQGVLNCEMEQYDRVMRAGVVKFNEFFAENRLQAEDLFVLYDTHGLSTDIIVDMMKARGLDCNIEKLDQVIDVHKEKSKKKDTHIALPYADTIFVEATETPAKVLFANDEYIVLDRSPFYAEAGGQIGDIGTISAVDASFSVTVSDTKKNGGVFVHKIGQKTGDLRCCDVIAKIDMSRRKQIRAHHSSAHLLFSAISKLIGSIKQMGSFVSDKKLRLDFTCQNALTDVQLTQIEIQVNEWVRENYPVCVEYMKYHDAIAAGAQAFFTYDNQVRTVRMADSFELCCGTHVSSLGEIGLFKILKCSSINAGVRRIEACCGAEAERKTREEGVVLKEIASVLGVDESAILTKLNIVLKKEVEVKIQIEQIGQWNIGFCEADEIDIEAQMLKHKISALLVIKEKNDKLSLVLKLNNMPHNALVIIKQLGKIIGATGGGGREDYAQTGGANIADKAQLFEALKKELLQ